jgi:tyrosyl-tRNA synthetase
MKFTTFPENTNVMSKKGIVKFGIDPTGPELHLGHLMPLRIVRKLKDNGCDVNIILGTFTAQIGDATGRDTTRPILSHDDAMLNASNILQQVERVLGKDIKFHFNADWFNEIKLPELMGIISKFSVQKLLNRDNFSNRMANHTPIAMHELMGPILQGIDSFKLKADIEVGGNDQLFNFVITREVQEMLGQKPEVCILSPVINGLDGRKMSKSFNNCIFLNDTPEDVFGKVMSISDNTMREWLPIFIDDIDVEKHPMKQKKELALQITTEIWNSELALKGSEHFDNVISNRQVPEHLQEVPIGQIVDVLQGLIKGSKSSVRRLFESNAIAVNGEKVGINDAHVFALKSGDIIKFGKRNFAKVI